MDHQQIMITNKNNNILRRMNRGDSQTILSKNKPQVRIIHIFAPEIIKTHPANFRELVQRLTGKQSLTREKGMRKKKSSSARNDSKRSDYGSSAEGSSSVERAVKSEEASEIWRSSSSSGGSGDNESGGFLTGFADMEDGFMQQLGYFQPSLDLLPQCHNPSLMQHHNHYNYTHTPQRHHQQQTSFLR